MAINTMWGLGMSVAEVVASAQKALPQLSLGSTVYIGSDIAALSPQARFDGLDRGWHAVDPANPPAGTCMTLLFGPGGPLEYLKRRFGP